MPSRQINDFFAKCKLKIIELVTRAGHHQATEEPSTSEGSFSPHMNAVLQPTIEVGGKEVAKYECHLCSQVFLWYITSFQRYKWPKTTRPLLSTTE